MDEESSAHLHRFPPLFRFPLFLAVRLKLAFLSTYPHKNESSLDKYISLSTQDWKGRARWGSHDPKSVRQELGIAFSPLHVLGGRGSKRLVFPAPSVRWAAPVRVQGPAPRAVVRPPPYLAALLRGRRRRRGGGGGRRE